MAPWPEPVLPDLSQLDLNEPVEIYDVATATRRALPSATDAPLYVCGITPYDATHIGHAATYIAFDTLNRLLRYSGSTVRLVSNVTDIDDPLLERAEKTGVDWKALAEEQTQLYCDDMEALGVIPPQQFSLVTEEMPAIRAAVRQMLEAGTAYRVPTDDAELQQKSHGFDDIYADLSVDERFGSLGNYDSEQMHEFFAERGGDPNRPGKRHSLDPLLWRQARIDEPSWDDDILGAGRPGWHIECAVIAREHLDVPMLVQGGGSDLIFPHHEMSVSHLRMLTGQEQPVHVNMNTSMVYLDGEKMSKSLGNLVFVSKLRASGIDPMAIRLALLTHHYRIDWHWNDEVLERAQARLDHWKILANVPAVELGNELWQILRLDVDTPEAVARIDAFCIEHEPKEAVRPLTGVDPLIEVEIPSEPTLADVTAGLLGIHLN